MFQFLRKKPKTKADRHLQFLKDIAKVYVRHSAYLSPKEMVILSQNRTTSASWINQLVNAVRGRRDG